MATFAFAVDPASGLKAPATGLEPRKRARLRTIRFTIDPVDGAIALGVRALD